MRDDQGTFKQLLTEDDKFDVQEGLGIEISKEDNVATISAKIGTNSELGIVKGDGITTFVDPDGTITSKSTLADIQGGDGIDITYGTGHNLPDEYIELLFVRGRAQCYLDTGINADSTTAFEVTAQRLANPSESFNVFGAVKTGAVAGVQFLNSNNARCFVGAYSADYTPTTTNVFFDKINFYGDINRRTIKNMATGEVTENTTAYTTAFDVGKNYYLGKINGLTSGADFTGRIFECKLWKDNVLVRHYVPAKVRETQEIGFYDIVNGTFNKSATAAQFTEGPDAVPSTVVSSKPFIGATETSAGTMGAVPAPSMEQKDAFLRGDGTWGTIQRKKLSQDEVPIYINNDTGKDTLDDSRGLTSDKAFKTVNYALNHLDELYDMNEVLYVSLKLDGFPDNVIDENIRICGWKTWGIRIVGTSDKKITFNQAVTFYNSRIDLSYCVFNTELELKPNNNDAYFTLLEVVFIQDCTLYKVSRFDGIDTLFLESVNLLSASIVLTISYINALEIRDCQFNSPRVLISSVNCLSRFIGNIVNDVSFSNVNTDGAVPFTLYGTVGTIKFHGCNIKISAPQSVLSLTFTKKICIDLDNSSLEIIFPSSAAAEEYQIIFNSSNSIFIQAINSKVFCNFKNPAGKLSYTPNLAAPYKLDASSLYIYNNEHTHFYYDAGHLGQKDASSFVYDKNGLVT